MLLSRIVESFTSRFSRTYWAHHCLGVCIELLPFVTLWIQSKRLWTRQLHWECKGQTGPPQGAWREDRLKGEATMPSSRYCPNYPRDLLVPLSFSWFIPVAIGPCPWLFLIGLYKHSILCSRRDRVLPFHPSVGLLLLLLLLQIELLSLRVFISNI